jgi:hypothetical protein
MLCITHLQVSRGGVSHPLALGWECGVGHGHPSLCLVMAWLPEPPAMGNESELEWNI